MLKKLTMLALLLALTIPAVSQHNQPIGERNSSQGSKDAQQPPPPSVPPITNNQTTAYYQQDGKEQPQGWHKFVTWPEGITAWLLMLTLGAIIWQAWETRQAAKATQASAEASKMAAKAGSDSAAAALKQVDVAMDSERAWLTAEVLNFGEPPSQDHMIWIEVAIANRGKTPARLHSVVATSKLVPTPNAIADATPGKLPPHPDYSDDRVIELRGYDVIVAPGDTFGHVHVYIWSREWGEIKTRKRSLYVYGTIEYSDTLKGDSHTTSFCSIYAVPLPGFGEATGFMFSQYIPATYFRAT